MKHQLGRLTGFAVVMKNLHSNGYRTEYWAYNPGVLNRNQHKALGVIAWKKISVTVREGDDGRCS